MSGESNPKIGGYSIGQVRRREAMHSLDQLSLEFRAAEDGCMVIGHVDHPQWMWHAVLLRCAIELHCMHAVAHPIEQWRQAAAETHAELS